MSYVSSERIEWSEDAASHIRNRSARYLGDTNIDPAWTVEVVNDPNRLVDEPDRNPATPTASVPPGIRTPLEW